MRTWTLVAALVAAPAAAAPPHVIVFIADDMACEDYGAYGHPKIRTPNLDRLGREGLRFDRAFLTCSSCSPSRSSLITGRYPHATGAWELHWPLPADQVTFPSLLKAAGYHAAAAGKWHLGEPAKKSFDAVRPAVSDMVKSLRDRPADKPFFGWFAFLDPHRPYDGKALDPPHAPADMVVPPYLPDTPEVRTDLAQYCDEIGRLDGVVGQVLAELDRQKIADDTLILFLSDNGRPFPRCKTTVYDSGIRTPLLARWPSRIKPGGTCDRLVSAVDLAPTLLELAGVKPAATVQGVSFAPLLTNPAGPPVRDAVFAEHNWHDYCARERAVRTERFKYIRNDYPDLPGTPPADAVRSPTFQQMRQLRDAGKLPPEQMGCFTLPRPKEELYDCQNDPHELKNLVEYQQFDDVLKFMRERLSQWAEETGDALPSERTPDEFDRETGERKTKRVPDGARKPPVGKNQEKKQEKTGGLRPPLARNVLFIAVDDLNDWVGCLNGHPQAHTPNMDRLASRGTLFTNAHCQAPLCNPSRTSVLTGLRPTTTGVYGLAPYVRSDPRFRDAASLPRHFGDHGYRTLSAGKIWHGGYPPKPDRDREFSTYAPGFPWPKPPAKFVQTPDKIPLMDWGPFPDRDEQLPDAKVADWAIEQLRKPGEKPFFLAVGFWLPHVPCYAPQPWFDRVSEADVKLPPVLDCDRNDTPEFSWYLHWKLPEPRLSWLQKSNQWKPLVRSYLASTSAVDHQIGRLLDALEKSPHADKTLVVLWSDHGWHLGEKGITGKNSLWERSTRVPLIFAGPGVTPGAVCRRPVELLDLFPTLNELCGLKPLANLEGQSLVPQLRDAAAPRDRPAVTTHNAGNHAVRTDRYRLIRYADGSEELYDLASDPNEWTNRAADPALSAVRAELAKWLPKSSAAPMAGSKHRVLTFDGKQAVWEDKPINPAEKDS